MTLPSALPLALLLRAVFSGALAESSGPTIGSLSAQQEAAFDSSHGVYKTSGRPQGPADTDPGASRYPSLELCVGDVHAQMPLYAALFADICKVVACEYVFPSTGLSRHVSISSFASKVVLLALAFRTGYEDIIHGIRYFFFSWCAVVVIYPVFGVLFFCCFSFFLRLLTMSLRNASSDSDSCISLFLDGILLFLTLCIVFLALCVVLGGAFVVCVPLLYALLLQKMPEAVLQYNCESVRWASTPQLPSVVQATWLIHSYAELRKHYGERVQNFRGHASGIGKVWFANRNHYGTLRVTVCEARQLKNVSVLRGKVSPLVKVRFHRDAVLVGERSTNKAKRCQDPVWNDVVEFPIVLGAESWKLHFEVLHCRHLFHDTSLGCTELLLDLPRWVDSDVEKQLPLEDGCGGTLSIKISFKPKMPATIYIDARRDAAYVGEYALVGWVLVRDKPIWKKIRQNYWLCSDGDGHWCVLGEGHVKGEPDLDQCHVRSSVSHGGRLPHRFNGTWKRVGFLGDVEEGITVDVEERPFLDKKHAPFYLAWMIINGIYSGPLSMVFVTHVIPGAVVYAPITALVSALACAVLYIAVTIRWRFVAGSSGESVFDMAVWQPYLLKLLSVILLVVSRFYGEAMARMYGGESWWHALHTTWAERTMRQYVAYIETLQRPWIRLLESFF